MSPTPTDILTWARRELPTDLPLPTPTDLDSLLAGPAAQNLWHFLTTRVKNPRNTRRARAALLLTQGAYRERRGTSPELSEVQQQLERVEAELAVLRQEAYAYGRDGEGVDGCVGGVRGAGVRELGMRVGEVLEGVEGVVEGVERVCGLERVGGEVEGERLRELVGGMLEEMCEVCVEGGDGVVGVEGGLARVVGGAGLGCVCEVLLGGVEGNLREVKGWRGEWRAGEGEDVERVGREVQQMAFGEYERVWGECEKAVREVERVGAEVGMVGLLEARVEGEKAVLRYLERGIEVGEGDRGVVGRLRREVGRGNEKVEEIFRACGGMREGSWRLLERGCASRERVAGRVKEEVRVRGEAVEGVKKWLREVERLAEWVGGVEFVVGEKGKGEGEGEEQGKGKGDVELMRRMEAEGDEGKMKEECEQVARRAELVGEMWEEMVGKVEQELVEQAECVIGETRAMKEAEVRFVQEELKNWLRCPAGDAARFMRLVPH